MDMVNYSTSINSEFVPNRVQISQESVEKMSFPNNFFDLVTAVETYYFWPKLADALTEILRVLKVNGKLILINELIKNGSFEVKYEKDLISKGITLLTFEEMKSLMQKTGFVDIRLSRNKAIWNLLTKRGARFWNVVIAKKQISY